MRNMNDIDPFDEIQCEEFVPEQWEGSPEPEPLTDAELEQQMQEWKKENPLQAQQLFEEIEAYLNSLDQ